MAPRLTHLALHVADLAATVAFYRRYAGMEIVHQRPASDDETRPGAVWLADPTLRDRFVLVVLPGGQPADQAARDYSHLGFALDSRKAVDDVARRAEAEGCLVWAPREEPPPVGYYCGVRDPSGRMVEFSFGQPIG